MKNPSVQSKDCVQCGDEIPLSKIKRGAESNEETLFCKNSCGDNSRSMRYQERIKGDPNRRPAFMEKERLRARKAREDRIAKGLCQRCGGVNDRKISGVLNCSQCGEHSNASKG